MNPFLAPLSVRTWVYSPASYSFTPVSSKASRMKIPSPQAFKFSAKSSFLSESDSSASSPPSLSYDIVTSVLPLSQFSADLDPPSPVTLISPPPSLPLPYTIIIWMHVLFHILLPRGRHRGSHLNTPPWPAPLWIVGRA